MRSPLCSVSSTFHCILSVLTPLYFVAPPLGYGYSEGALDTTMANFMTPKKIGSGLNTHNLIRQGWEGKFFDAEFENLDIGLYKRVLTRETIADIFREVNIPIDVDYVSIDVDSIDAWLLMGLLEGGYRPRVISVEYNALWAKDQLITCREEWEPWSHSSPVYGAGAGTIEYIGRKYGYKTVDIVPKLDMFMVKEDILQEKCPNYIALPTFDYLAESVTGWAVHQRCDRDEAMRRFVDLPLAMEGRHEEAKAKAAEALRDRNEYRRKYNQIEICREAGDGGAP